MALPTNGLIHPPRALTGLPGSPIQNSVVLDLSRPAPRAPLISYFRSAIISHLPHLLSLTQARPGSGSLPLSVPTGIVVQPDCGGTHVLYCCTYPDMHGQPPTRRCFNPDYMAVLWSRYRECQPSCANRLRRTVGTSHKYVRSDFLHRNRHWNRHSPGSALSSRLC